MSKTTSLLPMTFSESDQLQLQQLLTRQYLAGQSADEMKREEHGVDNQTILDQHALQPKKWRLIAKDVALHNWQSECLEKWLVRGKGTVKVATGGGKTIFALAVAQELQNRKEPDLRLAIVVPTIHLMHQWRSELKDANIPASSIGFMGEGRDLEESADFRILICVINSARDQLPLFVQNRNWSSKLLLVVDECHRANAEQAKKIFNASPRYTLGLSATPETDPGHGENSADDAYAKSEVGRGLGPIIFEFSLQESLDAGLLTPFEVWHIGLSFTNEEFAVYGKLSRDISELRKKLQIAHRHSRSKQGFLAWCQVQSKSGVDEATAFVGMTSERKRLVYRAKSRSDLALRILSLAMKDKNKQAIVFHESIAEINDLFINALQKKLPVVLEHSKLSNSLREANINIFRQGIARTVISAKSLVEGFNVPSADLGIIAASSGSVRQRIQSLGRMLRKKNATENAVVFVLYVKDTVDEAIYENADWESVIGAKRNRYFDWTPPTNDTVFDGHAGLCVLLKELHEIGRPPREYRPLCREVEESALHIGSAYPAQTTGLPLKVDQMGNLRTKDEETLLKTPKEMVEKVLELSKYRNAVRTPCGHLIVRTDGGAKNQTWIYLGNIDLPERALSSGAIKLTVKMVARRKVIAQKTGRDEIFAKTDETCESLLSWIDNLGKERRKTIHQLFWDGGTSYWVEVDGERIHFSENVKSLEFSS